MVQEHGGVWNWVLDNLESILRTIEELVCLVESQSDLIVVSYGT